MMLESKILKIRFFILSSMLILVSPVSVFVSGHWRILKKALRNLNIIDKSSSRLVNDYFSLTGQHQLNQRMLVQKKGFS